MFNLTKKEPSRALVPVDDVAGNLPFIVRRDHRIVAAFAKKAAAEQPAWNANNTSLAVCTVNRLSSLNERICAQSSAAAFLANAATMR